ncbi:hypothetical protein BU17DRAFT_83541 [Hysterangium stoloniferum]|nr:hypothetical protein BU17DRAFT_83541 [Hysterangium stoloniferum]
MEVDSPNPTPSLLERLGEPRRGGARGAARRASAPYQKRDSHALGSSNADADAVWKHDKHEPLKLSERLGREARPRVDTSNVRRALGQNSTLVSEGLNIKGASSSIVEVRGLVAGTTPEDVKAIFQSCGTITKATIANTSDPRSPHVHLYYTQPEHAQAAVNKFNGLPADGQKLSVTIFSMAQQIATVGKNQDLLDIAPARPVGKMYSDQIDDPRASVAVGDFTPDESSKGWRGGGRGRRGRGGFRRGTLGKMEIDH